MKTGKMHLAVSYTGKTCLSYHNWAWKETSSFQKACAAIPTGRTHNCGSSKVGSSVQVQDFGDGTAVALIRSKLVCAGTANSKLFLIIIRAVLREIWCWRTTLQLALVLGHLLSGDTSTLSLNWESTAAPLWQQHR